jgi:hypothetical protein
VLTLIFNSCHSGGVADAQLFAFPTPADTAMDGCATFGDVCTALADRLDRGDVEGATAELRMLARDYADVLVPVLPGDT